MVGYFSFIGKPKVVTKMGTFPSKQAQDMFQNMVKIYFYRCRVLFPLRSWQIPRLPMDLFQR
jgi:hypothetical protein